MEDLTREDILEILFEKCENVAQMRDFSKRLGLNFEWPSIKEQIVGRGKKDRVKRGRAKYGRDMYVVPGFEVEGHKPFPGFVCHPSAAIASAQELLRLAQEDGLLQDNE